MKFPSVCWPEVVRVMIESILNENLSKLFLPGGRLHGRYQPPQDCDIETVVSGAAWKTRNGDRPL